MLYYCHKEQEHNTLCRCGREAECGSPLRSWLVKTGPEVRILSSALTKQGKKKKGDAMVEIRNNKMSYGQSGVSSSYLYYCSGRIGVTENRNCQSARKNRS